MRRLFVIALVLLFALAGVGQARTTIEVWYHEYGEEGTYEAVLEYARLFEEAHPDIKVNVQWIPGDYGSRLNAALLSGQAVPDVFEVSGLDLDMIRQGLLVPLDDLFTEDIKDDFVEQALAQGIVDGTIYGVKTVIDSGVMYYNKRLLQDAGLEVPQTFAELVHAAETLTSGRRKGLFIGNDGGGAWGDMLIFANGVPELITPTEVVFNQPEYRDKTIEALEALRALNRSGVLLIGAPADWWDPSSLITGLTAMKWGGLWEFPEIRSYLGDDFAISPLPPMQSGGDPATFFGGWMSAVNANSRNIEAAKQFIKWLWIESTDLQIDWNVNYGFHIPPRQSVAAATEKLTEDPRAQAIVDFTFTYGRLGGGMTEWTGAMDVAFGDLIGAVLNTDDAIDALVDRAAARIQVELNKAQ